MQIESYNISKETNPMSKIAAMKLLRTFNFTVYTITDALRSADENRPAWIPVVSRSLQIQSFGGGYKFKLEP